jgi:hypothetical protein
MPVRPPPDKFRTMLMQLYAAHQLEVGYLEEVISRAEDQRGAAEALKRDPGGHVNGSLWHDGDHPPPSPRSVPPTLVQDGALQGCDVLRLKASDGHAFSFSANPSTDVVPRDVSFSSISCTSDEGDAVPELGHDELSEDGARSETSKYPRSSRVRLQEEGAAVPELGHDELRQDGQRDRRPNMTSGPGLPQNVDEEVAELGRGEFVWQWQRTMGGFRNYNPAQNQRIEEAYRHGHSKVRVRSGKDGRTPMEIFFVDMIQLDPQSRNLRAVRRLGAKSRYIEWGRHAQAIARSVFLGEPRLESFEKYKRRQQRVLGTRPEELASLDPSSGSESFTSSRNFYSARLRRLEMADNVCARITGSAVFFWLSMFFTALNVIWLGVSVEAGGFSQRLWDQRALLVILENGFMVYFLVQTILQLMSMKYMSSCFRSPWFRLDAVCTFSLVLEVLVLEVLASCGTITAGFSLAKQIFRLTRLAWVFKLFREVNDVVTALRGMIRGIRSAATIWIVLAVLLYTFSVVLTATSDDSGNLRDWYFGSLGQTITTLFSHGIAMDGVFDFLNDLRDNDGLFQGAVFTTFTFLTYFGLLNMLVGMFCSVAIETAVNEKDLGEIRYLEFHLEGIVECYMEDGSDQIDSEKFQLVMKNADVLQTLQACGTDIDGLMMLSEVLFPREDSQISFTDFFSVIVRLRKGKPATISEVIGLQEFTKQKMDKLEELILQGMRMKRSRSSTSSTGSALDASRVRRKIARQEEEIRPEQRSVRSTSRSSPVITATSADIKRSEAEKVRLCQHWIRHQGSSEFVPTPGTPSRSPAPPAALPWI